MARAVFLAIRRFGCPPSQMMQNKIKSFMRFGGLTNWEGARMRKADVSIAAAGGEIGDLVENKGAQESEITAGIGAKISGHMLCVNII